MELEVKRNLATGLLIIGFFIASLVVILMLQLASLDIELNTGFHLPIF